MFQILSFNSLQTEKCIQSNGLRRPRSWSNLCFNSLQTGKCIQSFLHILYPNQLKSFNSLQTGKCIQRAEQLRLKRTRVLVSIPFKRESVFRENTAQRNRERSRVSIPFKRESVFRVCGYLFPWKVLRQSFNSLQTGKCIQRDPILSPVGPGLRTPKTKRELREAFFTSKFTPKTPQTHVCIDPNAIFQQNRLRSETPSGFLGNLSRTRTRLVNRVWVYLLSIP